MNKILTGLALTSLVVPAFAQGTLHSPPMDVSVEGNRYAYYLGRYPDMKHQIVDSWHRGKTADIKEISFRLDAFNFTSTYGAGRTYSSVTLDIGEGDFDTFATYTTANFTSTPARVFSGSVTWPELSGVQPVIPDIWGGLSGDYRFPFSAPWKYGGKGDIVTDFGFSGGTLHNGGAWGATTSKYYRFDGSAPSTSSNSYVSLGYLPATRLNNSSTGVTGRCNDSEHGTTTTGAYIYGYVYAYSKYYSNRSWAGQMRYYTQSYYTGYENPVIHALGFQAETTGIDLATGCNRLHISGPMVFTPMMTFPEVVSTSGYSGYYETLLPWNAAFADRQLVFQAGWADSSTGQLALSQASHILTPSGLPENYDLKCKGTYTYSTSSTSGPSTSNLYYPSMRYTY